MINKHWITACFLVAIGCTGCAPTNLDMLHFLREREHNVSAIEYRVGIPDVINIHAPRIQEIDGETVRIQPDGKVSLKLIGDVKIAGMTPKEIGVKLEILLSEYYVDPKVTVRIFNYASKKYYVHGEGVTVGTRPYTGRDTLLDAVGPAASNFLAWTQKVKVVRPSFGDRPVRTIEVDVHSMIHTGDWSQNILLEPDDIVYVPPTPLAWIAHRVNEVLFPVAPIVQAYVAPASLRGIDGIYSSDSNINFNQSYFSRGIGSGALRP